MARIGREIYEFDEFRFDVSEHLLLRRNEPVALPDKAFETLHLLVGKAGHLVEKDEILKTVWADAFVEENNLDKSVSILRRALGEKKGGKKFIETVRGHGYRFVEKVNVPHESPPPLSLADHGSDESGSVNAADHIPLPMLGMEPEAQYSHPRVRRTGNVLAVAEWQHDVPDTKQNGQPIAETKQSASSISKKFRNLVAAGVVVVTLVGIGSLLNYFVSRSDAKARSSSPPFEAFKIKRYSDNGNFNPSVISSDGKFIAFTDKKYGIWLKNTATDSNIKVLAETDTGERSIIGFSPDDSYVYFLASGKDKWRQILKMAVLGGAAPVKIAEDVWSQPTLSPDGQRISFTRYTADTKAFTVVAAETDGSSEKTIAQAGIDERFDNWTQNTAWSPDETFVACIGRKEINTGVDRYIQVFRASDGGEVMRIKPDPSITSLISLAWLPNGEDLLVIAADQSSLGQIYRYTVATGAWKRITNDLSDYLNLSVSSDGKTVLTTIFNNQSNLWVMPVADPGHPQQITFGFNTIYDSTGVSWTADGHIVYATNAGGRWEIWKINANGSGLVQLTQNCAGNDICAMPFASPDNKYVVFQASRNGEYNIWRMDADGGDPVQLTSGGGITPSVTPDGRSVLYIKKKVSSYTLWQVPIGGGEPRQLSQMDPVFLGNLSPDGRQLAFVHYDQKANSPFQTCVAPLDALKPEKCFDNSRAFPTWTADGKAYYYLAHDYSGLMRQSLDGKLETIVSYPDERANTFAVSPDGKNIVIARSRPTQDVVALMDER
jgi:Tol biopolymer transport system component/DNA-binding winged helix-turn-helix (wHTH) protein